MNWEIGFTKEALKFLESGRISKETIFGFAKMAIRKFQGEDVNIDIKKLKGEWSGFYRIRKGNLRVIIEIDFDNLFILIERVDLRGNVYK